MRGVAIVTGDLVENGERERSGSVVSAMLDAFVFLAVLTGSALAIIVIAFAAPLAIAVSALAGALTPHRRPRPWQGAHAG